MDDIGPESPTLPSWALIPVVIASFLVIIFVLMRARSRSGGFIIAAGWVRYVVSAFANIANRPGAMGLSGNAMVAALSFGLGVFFIRPRNLLIKYLVPIYVLMLLAIISAAVNGTTEGLVLVLVKYGYLAIVTVGVYEAMRRHPDGRFMRLFLWTFFTPLVCQVLSIALGVVKATENDGSASYIGGYHHEATFSVVIATCVVAAAFATNIHKYLKAAIIVGCVYGIYMANYRTTILAIAPLLIVYFGFSSVRGFIKKDRPLVVSAVLVLGAIVLGVISLFLADRFSDLGVATSGQVNLFKRPEEFTVDESRILSGRPMIWMKYIFGWYDGGLMQHFFGFGPESWSRSFNLYAHNTLVNDLYEYGVFGVMAILYLWFSMLTAAQRVRHPQKGLLVAAHFSFLLLNMGTMPMWMIEGDLLYGVICGYTLYCLSAPQEMAPRPVKAKRARGRWDGRRAPPAGEPQPTPEPAHAARPQSMADLDNLSAPRGAGPNT